MTRIGNPAPGLVATPLPHGAPALLAELPSSLNNVALGTFLTGTVLERGANGLTLLQTAHGLLGLKTTVPLPPGSAVTLQIQTAGAQLQAIVLSITPQAAGASPAATQAGAPPAGQPSSVATPNAPAANVATPQPAAPSTITATVIGPSGGPVPPVAAQAAPPQGAAPPQSAVPSQATPTTPAPSSSQAGPSPAAPAAATTVQVPLATTTAQPATPQTALPNAQLPSPTVPAAAQAAYQRQLNAVPAASPAPVPLPAASPQPAPSAPVAPTPPLLAQETAAKPPASDLAPPPLPTGTQVQVRLLPSLQAGLPHLAQPPEAHAETAVAIARQAAATHANPVIMATVVARTPAGQVILDSAVGRLLAALPRDGDTTAPGARLMLELITGERPAAAPRAAQAQSGLAALARNWQGLKDAMRQLQESPGQQDAYAALERALPKPGPRLAQQMLSYLETAQQGLKAWLGETVARALAQSGRGPEQLERDMREMQLARQNAEGDWRMTLVPLLDGNQLRQIRFFERRRKQEAQRKKEEPARFVVECETSAHGAIQLDGLMHEQRLDLIVRSHEPLPSEMERDILLLFGQTCTGLNLAGQLFFQAVPTFPINPLDEVAAEPVRVSV